MTIDIWKWIVIGSLGYAGVILSHNLTAMMVTPFLIIVVLLYCYIAYKKKNLLTSYFLLLTSILGLMLSAFYWIPALLEMKYTNILSQIGGGADFRDHFVCIGQLWESIWGFGGSIPGCIDGLSFRVGKFHLLSVALSLLTILFTLFISNRYFTKNVVKHSNDINHYSDKIAPIIFSILGFVVSIFFMLEASRPIWETVGIMEFFQYPWRFLLLASFFSSLLAGFVIWFFSSSVKNLRLYVSGGVSALLILMLLYSSIKLFSPQTMLLKTSSDYTNEYALKWTASKISDEFLPPNFKKPKSEREIPKELAIPPQESLAQKIANAISLTGILIVAVGIIIASKKRLHA